MDGWLCRPVIEMVGCLLGWKILFHDGTTLTTVSSKDSAWNDAPSINVQYVILYFATHRQVLGGRDNFELPKLLGLEGSETKTGSLINADKFAPLKQIIVDNNEKF